MKPTNNLSTEMAAILLSGVPSASCISRSTNSGMPSASTPVLSRINPYTSEIWFDLGSLYESCNNQISDAIGAYMHVSELDPNNPVIS